MQIQEDISLKPYNTFGLNARAKYFLKVETVQELKDALSLTAYPDKFILGGGSNMLLTKDLDCLVIQVALKGIEIIEHQEDDVLIKANAGENWHEFVMWCLKHDFGGLENLSLIPGNVGTAPIQNIGAYGVEIKDTLESCEALNIATKTIETFTNDQCQFDYRESIFKQDKKNAYVILSATFKLTTGKHQLHMDYGAIRTELEAMSIVKPTIQDVSKAVIAIRESKLPNPKDIGNSGSFFKNPIISKTHFDKLKNNFPEIPSYPVSPTEVKVPAGWLIEKSGFKGKTFDEYGVHKKQALVLVNYGNAKGSDIFDLAKLIQKTIQHIFGIRIEMEVNII
ncbi:UDP-N-acetylmuramate dehydrogenase [Gelidibacter salicanalis]|uniref:UDP-N-acetylenolpyruvoylglucosamine reductase n=1 Tax=Gelidibacter salicanalis TaxID=291193 RepID=A0A934NAZ3_9FLAO|nr:UDP-N-acetylmuramate dehydrogenase [Gelidibacter salicanalis]MBJ7879075.1 UDP-N-acetylmuramate dehydrogenase [Gelidibacter salicanalis]